MNLVMEHIENTLPTAGVFISTHDGNATKETIRDFLQTLYGDGLEAGYLVLWTRRDRASDFFAISQLDDAANKAASLCENDDVYYGVGIQRSALFDGRRGGSDGVMAIPGLWLDVDIRGSNHRCEKLPADADAAMRLLESYDLKPTLIVSTGGGLHVYWLFTEPMVLRTDQDRERARNLCKRFQTVFIALAARQGWQIDDTSDISRLLRLPGTYNYKRGTPVPVVVAKYNQEKRYSVPEIEASLSGYVLDESGSEEEIPEGTRNTMLTRIAGVLRGRGLAEEEILSELSSVNQERCKPPLSDEEVAEIARSVSSYEPNDSGAGRTPTQAERIVALADNIRLFHAFDDQCYVEIPVNGHKEVWPLNSKGFRDYLSKSYYDQYGSVPSSQSLQNAFGVLRGRALFETNRKPVFVRLAQVDDAIYLDLCNEDWEFVRITSEGWDIVTESPVCFRRPKGMKQLPKPVTGGRLRDLLKFVNVDSKQPWVLIVSWLLGALNPTGPYPILILHGEQGSAKSTTARILRELIDSSAAPLKTLPRNEHDLMISAQNGRVLAFDNLSGISPAMSDALCRLSTGGGFATRGLYTDSEEIIFEAMRPIILNGIDDLANRNDLADRALIVSLPRIPERKRKVEQDLWKEFEAAKPKLLGVMLNAVSFGLRHLNEVRLRAYPRMADFAKWVVAAEPKLPWRKGEFLEIYQQNREESALASFESDVVAIALRAFIEDIKEWEGTSTELLQALEGHMEEHKLIHDKSWPRRPNYLSGRVNRIAPSLRRAGIEVESLRRQGRKIWRFKLSRGVDSPLGA